MHPGVRESRPERHEIASRFVLMGEVCLEERSTGIGKARQGEPTDLESEMATNELLEGEVELWRNGQWRVTNMHLEEIADPELAGPPYWIPLNKHLTIGNWPEHVCQKTWVDADQFVEAYRKACEVVGVKPDEASIARALNPEPDEILEFIRGRPALVADNDVSDAF